MECSLQNEYISAVSLVVNKRAIAEYLVYCFPENMEIFSTFEA